MSDNSSLEPLTFFESYGAGGSGTSLYVNEGRAELRQSKQPQLTHLFDLMKQVFLPQGFPQSVSSDYVSYQIWDTVQAFCSSITGTLAAQAVLKGYGVGDHAASLTAATVTWLLKDGSSMVGRIVFAWAKGSQLDSECKKYRLVADILNDSAIFVQLVSPHFPSIFTILVCFSGLLNAIVGVAGSATRAALTMHQARRNNMADVSAKDNSQETLVNLAALACNMLLVPLVTGNYPLIFLLFVIFTCFHVYANWRAVKAVCMETFNKGRLHLVVDSYLSSNQKQVMSVQTANLLEPLFYEKSLVSIDLGVSLKKIHSICTADEISQIATGYKPSGHKYMLFCTLSSQRRCHVYILLLSGATEGDQIRSFIQAEVIAWCFRNIQHSVTEPFKSLSHSLSATSFNPTHASLLSLSICDSIYDNFVNVASVKNSWIFSPVLLGADEFRIDLFYGKCVIDEEFTLI